MAAHKHTASLCQCKEWKYDMNQLVQYRPFAVHPWPPPCGYYPSVYSIHVSVLRNRLQASRCTPCISSVARQCSNLRHTRPPNLWVPWYHTDSLYFIEVSQDNITHSCSSTPGNILQIIWWSRGLNPRFSGLWGLNWTHDLPTCP